MFFFSLLGPSSGKEALGMCLDPAQDDNDIVSNQGEGSQKLEAIYVFAVKIKMMNNQ